MAWDEARTRGAELVVGVLRDRWRLATLFALEGGALQPGTVLKVFTDAAAEGRNVTVFGEHTVYQRCVYRHMSELFNGGFLDKHSVRSARAETFYGLTDVASGVLAAIGPAIDFGLTVFPELVALSQAFRKAEHVPVGPPDLSGLDPEALGRVRRRVAVLLFGVLLHPAWTVPVLAGLSAGPVRLDALTARINKVIAASPDVLTTGSVSRATVHAQFKRLHRLGYAHQVDDTAGRNPDRFRGAPEHASALTDLGRALLDSLVPAAEFGIAHDEELSIMARALMRGKRGGSSKRGTLPPPSSSL